jgi:hypothetical protein
MPFLGSTAGGLASAGIVTHDRTYLPLAGGGTVWIRTLNLPRVSFHVEVPGAPAPVAVVLQYATGGGVFKVITHPLVAVSGVAYDLHLPARWCRLQFPAGFGGLNGRVHFHASSMS